MPRIGVCVVVARTDVNFKSYADVKDLVIKHAYYCPETVGKKSEDFDDLFKLSHVENALIEDTVIEALGMNREDGADIMRRSKNVTFRRVKITAGKRYVFTVKGGCRTVELNDVLIIRPGKWVDIDLGNRSHLIYEKTTDIKLINVRRLDGKPVRVRVGFAGNPKIIGGNCKVLFWQSLFLKVFVWFMHKIEKPKK